MLPCTFAPSQNITQSASRFMPIGPGFVINIQYQFGTTKAATTTLPPFTLYEAASSILNEEVPEPL